MASIRYRSIDEIKETLQNAKSQKKRLRPLDWRRVLRQSWHTHGCGLCRNHQRYVQARLPTSTGEDLSQVHGRAPCERTAVT